jgi:hypothetical protein
VLNCCTKVVGCIDPERKAVMNFSLFVSRPSAQAQSNGSGSVGPQEIRADSTPTSSAARANCSQPSMSGRRAGESRS